jgi:alkylhydroperoxidase/carboxymuconolactone decarboxylase family protein YurZ
MAKTSPPKQQVAVSFVSKVEKLVKRWEPIRADYQKLAERHIQFAVMIKDLWLEAKDLDKGTGERKHADFMREKLRVLIETDDESILTRWRTIGKFSDQLLPHASHLPSDRDHLYELALAVKQDKPLADWVKSKEVHPAVQVRYIRDLKRGTERKKSKATDTRRNLVQIRFIEGVTAKEVASLLEHLMVSEKVEQIRSATPGLQASAKANLREKFQAIAHKFPQSGRTLVKSSSVKK